MNTLLILALGLSSSMTALAGNPSVDCAREAYHWFGDANMATRLCYGASSMAPFECAKAAYSVMGDQNLSMYLCARVIDAEEPVECLKNAYAANGGDYTQAVILCIGVR